ncbi:hypothetical protein QZH41_016905 [Actinostola sp. cb2023]|nr:hypothetical protein QZH41_016905 [Actinostola sp. cb2023]
MEWIPRHLNGQADYLSRIYDADDWAISHPSFSSLDAIWSPHSIERFANHLNHKLIFFSLRCGRSSTRRSQPNLQDVAGKVKDTVFASKADGTLVCQEASSPSPVLTAVYSIDWVHKLSGYEKASGHPLVHGIDDGCVSEDSGET